MKFPFGFKIPRNKLMQVPMIFTLIGMGILAVTVISFNVIHYHWIIYLLFICISIFFLWGGVKLSRSVIPKETLKEILKKTEDQNQNTSQTVTQEPTPISNISNGVLISGNQVGEFKISDPVAEALANCEGTRLVDIHIDTYGEMTFKYSDSSKFTIKPKNSFIIIGYGVFAPQMAIANIVKDLYDEIELLKAKLDKLEQPNNE